MTTKKKTTTKKAAPAKKAPAKAAAKTAEYIATKQIREGGILYRIGDTVPLDDARAKALGPLVEKK